MRKVFIIAFLLFVFFPLAAAKTVSAATYYVATTGSDGGSCTQTAPCRTIKQGVSKLAGGDTLIVKAGTYAETLVNFSPPSGTDSAYTTIKAADGETVWLRPTSFSTARTPTNLRVVELAGGRHHIKIERINIDGAGLPHDGVHGVTLLSTGDRTHHLIFDGMELKNSRGDMIHFRPASYGNVLRNSYLHHVGGSVGSNKSPAGGLYLRGPACPNGGSYICNVWPNVQGNIIENNIFEGVKDVGIGMREKGIVNNTIRGNVFNNGDAMAIAIGGDKQQGIKIYNNIINNQRNCIWFYYGESPTTKIYNNTFYNSGNDAWGCFAQPKYVDISSRASNNIHNNILYKVKNINGAIPSSNFTADPKFINPEAGNFCLQPGSPATGKGADCKTVGPGKGSSGGTTFPGDETGSACHRFTPSDPLVDGYAAAYNPLSSSREMLVTAKCSQTQTAVEVGSGNPQMYVYSQGYKSSGGAWTPLTYTCTGQTTGNWCVGKATAALSQSDTWFVAYTCQWNGTQWKCGCRDAACSQNYWQLQGIKK